MKINRIHELKFDTDETIVTATISKSNEVILLMISGDVIRFNLDDQKGVSLFSVKSDIGYSDGGFDLTAKTSIYTLDEIVVVVNDFQRHGFIHYPDKFHALHLWREDYYADISTYPIALFKKDNGIPHLIYASAWNHIQIMNLDTRQILTAAKSLIEENAEESHIEFYKKHNEDNKLAWPRPYDYFFGKLFLSPNQKNFLSAGWAWGSCDSYNIFDIEMFINSNRISALGIGNWEHETRATCWIDNENIAVAYNPFTEGDANSTVDSQSEIHFYEINKSKIEIKKKIQIPEKFSISSKMYFNKANGSLITFCDDRGLKIISLDGQIVFKDGDIKVNEYNVETGLFLGTDNNTISVYEITK